MTRPRLEVADVIRQYGADYLARYGAVTSTVQRRALQAIAQCRTAALGGHKAQCDHCGHEEISYNSCRNRHCPKCQGSAQAAWLAARERELLDVPYCHLVFTLSAPCSPLALQHPCVVYTLLFQAVAETLQTIARDPKHLGAEIGFLGVLHTWGQTLHHHPHIHCLVPAGGLALDGTALGPLSPTLLSPSPRPQSVISPHVPDRAAAGGCPRAPQQAGPTMALSRGVVPGPEGHAADGVGGLRQAAAAWTTAGPALPRPLHASCGHHQSAAPRLCRLTGCEFCKWP